MPTKAYQCGSCYEVHEFYHEAESCCQPTIDEGWSCDVCADFHSEKEDAAKCCIGLVKTKAGETVQCPGCLRDQALMQLIAEIEVTGHCSECNPHYSSDEAFKIADLVDRRIEEHVEQQLG
ncbi:hypothetical protein QN382_19925 [Pseudomonas sp. 10B1]|uniref:hypothetical protein n=1 Tax=Pseudomonas sp. 10B1 TaxID=3048573 RepID=UPI002B221E4C|nr:hypothetical protein [Pseudomonas sp. 10B1]MEB0311546.1 hypothetical protein [Pseudomonas sp. 10B1]